MLDFKYDEATNVLTVEGISYSGALFQTMAKDRPGTWLRIEKRDDGAVTCRRFSRLLEDQFNALAGLPKPVP